MSESSIANFLFVLIHTKVIALFVLVSMCEKMIYCNKNNFICIMSIKLKMFHVTGKLSYVPQWVWLEHVRYPYPLIALISVYDMEFNLEVNNLFQNLSSYFACNLLKNLDVSIY